MRPTVSGEIYKEPIRAEVYNLIVDDPDDYIGFHNHTKRDQPRYYSDNMSLEDLGVLVYLYNKLQQVDKEAEISTTISIDLLKR